MEGNGRGDGGAAGQELDQVSEPEGRADRAAVPREEEEGARQEGAQEEDPKEEGSQEEAAAEEKGRLQAPRVQPEVEPRAATDDRAHQREAAAPLEGAGSAEGAERAARYDAGGRAGVQPGRDGAVRVGHGQGPREGLQRDNPAGAGRAAGRQADDGGGDRLFLGAGQAEDEGVQGGVPEGVAVAALLERARAEGVRQGGGGEAEEAGLVRGADVQPAGRVGRVALEGEQAEAQEVHSRVEVFQNECQKCNQKPAADKQEDGEVGGRPAGVRGAPGQDARPGGQGGGAEEEAGGEQDEADVQDAAQEAEEAEGQRLPAVGAEEKAQGVPGPEVAVAVAFEGKQAQAAHSEGHQEGDDGERDEEQS